MRTLLLFLSFNGLYAADFQKLTFSDGSVKVGYVDERSGNLTLHNGVVVPIEVDRIVRRDPATLPPKTVAETPPTQPTKAADPQGETTATSLEASGAAGVKP